MMFLHLCVIFCILNIYGGFSASANDNFPPKLIPVLKQGVQKVNTNFQITCSVQEASQPFFFDWHKNGRPLKTGPDVSYKVDIFDISSTLTIKKIQRSDQANYTCLVKNAFGSDSQTVQLIVKGNELILIRSHNLNARTIGGAMVSVIIEFLL